MVAVLCILCDHDSAPIDNDWRHYLTLTTRRGVLLPFSLFVNLQQISLIIIKGSIRIQKWLLNAGGAHMITPNRICAIIVHLDGFHPLQIWETWQRTPLFVVNKVVLESGGRIGCRALFFLRGGSPESELTLFEVNNLAISHIILIRFICLQGRAHPFQSLFIRFYFNVIVGTTWNLIIRVATLILVPSESWRISAIRIHFLIFFIF